MKKKVILINLFILLASFALCAMDNELPEDEREEIDYYSINTPEDWNSFFKDLKTKVKPINHIAFTIGDWDQDELHRLLNTDISPIKEELISTTYDEDQNQIKAYYLSDEISLGMFKINGIIFASAKLQSQQWIGSTRVPNTKLMDCLSNKIDEYEASLKRRNPRM